MTNGIDNSHPNDERIRELKNQIAKAADELEPLVRERNESGNRERGESVPGDLPQGMPATPPNHP